MGKKRNKNKWHRIVKKLQQKKYTIATMESCTGGGIANEITNIPGASSVIKESFVTYSNEAKIKQGVSEKTISEFTVYSSEIAIEMARATRKNANSDISIGVTGQLGRIDPNNPVDKLNCVYVAVIEDNTLISLREIHVPNFKRKKQKKFVINEVAYIMLNVL